MRTVCKCTTHRCTDHRHDRYCDHAFQQLQMHHRHSIVVFVVVGLVHQFTISMKSKHAHGSVPNLYRNVLAGWRGCGSVVAGVRSNCVVCSMAGSVLTCECPAHRSFMCAVTARLEKTFAQRQTRRAARFSPLCVYLCGEFVRANENPPQPCCVGRDREHSLRFTHRTPIRKMPNNATVFDIDTNTLICIKYACFVCGYLLSQRRSSQFITSHVHFSLDRKFATQPQQSSAQINTIDVAESRDCHPINEHGVMWWWRFALVHFFCSSHFIIVSIVIGLSARWHLWSIEYSYMLSGAKSKAAKHVRTQHSMH